MNWKSFFDNPEEIFVSGTLATLPLYWVVHWWVIPIVLSGWFLWRFGGMDGGWKPARWLILPIIICTSTYFTTYNIYLFLSVPFMVKIAPSYGKNSWLFKLLKNDFLTRLICFIWYWGSFSIFYSFSL